MISASFLPRRSRFDNFETNNTIKLRVIRIDIRPEHILTKQE